MRVRVAEEGLFSQVTTVAEKEALQQVNQEQEALVVVTEVVDPKVLSDQVVQIIPVDLGEQLLQIIKVDRQHNLDMNMAAAVAAVDIMEEVLEVLVYLYVRVLLEMGLVAEDLVFIGLQKEL